MKCQWDTGVPRGSTSQTEEVANSKPLHLERSSSCRRNSRKPMWLERSEQWILWEEGGQGGKWGHVTEGFIGHSKDLGFYSE